MLQLNLGCGIDQYPPADGWVNIDNDLHITDAVHHDVTNLPYRNEADHVFAKHLLEHFDRTVASKLLSHWRSTMKEGATIEIIVPDFKWACGALSENGSDHTLGQNWWKSAYNMVYGVNAFGMGHKAGFNLETLEIVMRQGGFHDVKVENIMDDWCPSIKATGVKPAMGCVDIIIPCWNHVEHTDKLLNSLMATDHEFRLILIDNGSTDATANIMEFWKRQKPDTIIIKNDNNLGFVKAVNQGFAVSDSPFVMILNNDTEIEPRDYYWLDRMLSHFNSDVGAVGPTSTYVLGFQKNEWTGLPMHHEVALLSGFCILLSRKSFDTVGMLDERFGMGGNDDLDYCLRLADEGFKIVIARDVFIRHEGSVSLLDYTAELYDREPDTMLVDWLDQETRETLVDKWGQQRVDDMLVFHDLWKPVGKVSLA